MKKNNIIIGTVAAVSIAALTGGAAVYALQTNAAEEGGMFKRGASTEVREAIENKDYNAFKEATSEKCHDEDRINEENFSRFTEMHELRHDGKLEESEAIREELGLPKRQGQGQGTRGGNPEMREALESGDYNAFKEAVGDKPMAEKITEENFSKFVEMHNMREEGNHDEAKVIADELGIQKQAGKGSGQKGRGMHK